MEDDEIIGFSWSTLFIVTSISAFIFTGVLWLLDGDISIIFLSIAVAMLVLSILNGIFKFFKN